MTSADWRQVALHADRLRLGFAVRLLDEKCTRFCDDALAAQCTELRATTSKGKRERDNRPCRGTFIGCPD